MAKRYENIGDILVSPTCISDYFRSTKNSGKGSKSPKTSDIASVYLTPESSPAKDKSSVSPETKVVESQICNIQLQNNCICNGAASREGNDDLALESHLIDGTSVLVDIRTTQNTMVDIQDAVVNGKSSEDTDSIEECKTPILSHSRESDYGTRSKTPASSAVGRSSASSHDEPSACSSPLLPRPKVRKGAKPKKSVNEMPATDLSDAKPKPNRRKKKESVPVQNSTITDYFPVRRSGRQTKGEIKKQREELLEKLITSNSENGLEVKHFEGKGRGVVATKRFEKGDFVIEYAGDFIDISSARDRESKYSETPEVGCYMYFFFHAGKHYCVDATAESDRLGRLINHSRDGNCRTEVVSLKDGPRLILVAAKDIEEGQELSYDYGDRRKSSLEAHPWLKL